MIGAGVPFILTRTGGVWLPIASRILCATWAYCLAVEEDGAPNVKRDSKRLLEQAARLENSNPLQAIDAYQKIIDGYPGTLASKEAARNIKVLQSRHVQAA